MRVQTVLAAVGGGGCGDGCVGGVGGGGGGYRPAGRNWVRVFERESERRAASDQNGGDESVCAADLASFRAFRARLRQWATDEHSNETTTPNTSFGGGGQLLQKGRTEKPRRQDCHFADTPSNETLTKGRRAGEQNDSLADGYSRS